MTMPHQALVMVQFLLLSIFHAGLVCSTDNKTGMLCLENERHILLELKEGLDNKSTRFASWVGNDCCSWPGVRCDKLIGHVISLHLSISFDDNVLDSIAIMKASLKPSLVGLVHLQSLDLSFNNFAFSPFPSFIGSFQNLRYLDLSSCNFSGPIPEQFGNLSSLHYLDLSRNDIHENGGSWLQKLSSLHSTRVLKLDSCGLSSLPKTLPNSSFTSLLVLNLGNNDLNTTIPEWLYRITSLQHLDLSFCSFQGIISHDIGALSSMEFLTFEGNMLQGIIPVEIGNLSNLLTLSLSENSLDIEIDHKGPGSCCNLRELYLYNMQIQRGIDLKGLGNFWSWCTENSLKVLDISGSDFFGILPDWLWELENLETLNLQENSIFGSIPAGIGKLSSLKSLDISHNLLNGSIDKAIGNLSKLEVIDLYGGNLRGVLTETHFSRLVRLSDFQVSGNSLAVDVSSKWIPPFQLESISMSDCPLGPYFPPWLQGQKKLRSLEMSSTLIGSLPNWFWSFALNLDVVKLANNNIHGEIPSLLSAINNSLTRDSSSTNSSHGVMKIPSSRMKYLDLSNNSFSGLLPVDFAEAMPNLTMLHLSMNNFTGSVPYSLCDLAQLQELDLSKNGLLGHIPSCWNKTSNLYYINFGYNYLSGEFPCSFCFSNSFEFIQLNDNNLSGTLPHCLYNCTNLYLLDIGTNMLTGSIARWFGDSLLNLMALSLRSNFLVGRIPPQLSFFNNLQILDLSDNSLSGEIPPSLGNLTGMKLNPESSNPLFVLETRIIFGLDLKGSYLHYYFLHGEYLASIDLSCNKLSGDIPINLTDLIGLQNLNLSFNHLEGEIPSKIGKLRNLESLDLSRNQLNGPIPDSLSNLSFLSHLNLSYNLLSGKIPTGQQLQTLTDPSIYEGNLNLCGPPLNNSCETQSGAPPSSDYIDSNQSGGDSIWNLGSMGFGFAAGLLGFCGFILYQSKWGDAYLHFVDMVLYKIFFKWLS